MYQKCPICNGTGIAMTIQSSNSVCPTCQGKRIISELTGLPPNKTLEELVDELKPIELPSDKEIEKQALLAENNDLSPVEEWERGAKWLKEYITKTK